MTVLIQLNMYQDMSLEKNWENVENAHTKRLRSLTVILVGRLLSTLERNLDSVFRCHLEAISTCLYAKLLKATPSRCAESYSRRIGLHIGKSRFHVALPLINNERHDIPLSTNICIIGPLVFLQLQPLSNTTAMTATAMTIATTIRG